MSNFSRFEPREHPTPYLPDKVHKELFSEHAFRDKIFGVHALEIDGRRALEIQVRDEVPGNVRSDLVRFGRSLEQGRLVAGHAVYFSEQGTSVDKAGKVQTHGRHYRLILHLK